MTLQFEQIRTTERSYWLDVLRGLAIFGVVAVHSIQSTNSLVLNNKSELFFWMISLGKYGVELFFFYQVGYSYQSMG
jgi:peptidoglycan/LPS O-acetylase OafA/YrhL